MIELPKEVIDTIAQAGIALFGFPSIVLLARKNKWGMACGLLSEPFWFATAIINHQWGVILLDIAYTAGWGYGCYVWFFKKTKEAE